MAGSDRNPAPAEALQSGTEGTAGEQVEDSLPDLFRQAMCEAEALETSNNPTCSSEFQEGLVATLSLFDRCDRLTHDLGIFSQNEDAVELSTADLQYLVIRFHLGDLTLRDTQRPRKRVLKLAQAHFNAFLHRLEDYAVLGRDDLRAWEACREQWDDEDEDGKPRTRPSVDPEAARTLKVERKKREMAARKRMKEVMEELSSADQERIDAVEEDELYREHAFLLIEAATRAALDHLASMNTEAELLAHAEKMGLTPGQGPRPPAPPPPSGPPPKNIVINSREEARAAVFKTTPGWTMTVEEFGEQEMREMQEKEARAQAARRAEIEEYAQQQGGLVEMHEVPNQEENDEETEEKQMKARAWDDWMDENPAQRNRGISGR